MNLSRNLRPRAGIYAAGLWKRGFATPAFNNKTQTTTLKNGLTVSQAAPPRADPRARPNWPRRVRPRRSLNASPF